MGRKLIMNILLLFRRIEEQNILVEKPSLILERHSWTNSAKIIGDAVRKSVARLHRPRILISRSSITPSHVIIIIIHTHGSPHTHKKKNPNKKESYHPLLHLLLLWWIPPPPPPPPTTSTHLLFSQAAKKKSVNPIYLDPLPPQVCIGRDLTK